MKPESKVDHEPKLGITVRTLQESDLDEADRIMRLAFGTFIGLPDPTQFMGDADYVRTRWRANPAAAFAAEAAGQLVGSNFATRWGTVGFFGPLTIHPEFWDRGVGKRLLEPIVQLFSQWSTTHTGLFTFAHSQKHVGLYQKFGFWPRFLTALMSRPVEKTTGGAEWSTFSQAPADERESIMAAGRELTGSIYEGLDLTAEIAAVAKQNLGETVLLWKANQLSGLAVCHCGPGTEAGSGTCYIKFGAVRSGANAEVDFNRLLDACEQMAAKRGLARLFAGVNTARQEAYQQMLARGFRTEIQGVVMSRPNEGGLQSSRQLPD